MLYHLQLINQIVMKRSQIVAQYPRHGNINGNIIYTVSIPLSSMIMIKLLGQTEINRYCPGSTITSYLSKISKLPEHDQPENDRIKVHTLFYI